jgi:hypothetical protein
VFFIDIEHRDEMSTFPNFYIDYDDFDSLGFQDYIRNRFRAIDNGRSGIVLSLASSNELTIAHADKILNEACEYIHDNYPDYTDQIVVQIEFSSKSDDWLIVPPPPSTYE